MGEVGDPPFYYQEFRAAEALGCSVIELRERPDGLKLMSEALAYLSGKSEGETALQCNPKFKQQAKALRKRME